MSTGWVIIWLIAATLGAIRFALFTHRAIAGTRAWAGRARRQPRPRHAIQPRWRPGDRRWQAAGRQAARELMLTLIGGEPPPAGCLPAGLIPAPGETPLQAVTAGHATWGTTTRRAGGLPVNMLIRRTRIGGRQVTATGWIDYGHAEWVITTARLTARLPGIKDPVSIWWQAITGITADPHAGTVTLDAADEWQGIFYGPAIAPLAIAAIAAYLGPAALTTEPALAWLPAPPPSGARQARHQR